MNSAHPMKGFQHGDDSSADGLELSVDENGIMWEAVDSFSEASESYRMSPYGSETAGDVDSSVLLSSRSPGNRPMVNGGQDTEDEIDSLDDDGIMRPSADSIGLASKKASSERGESQMPLGDRITKILKSIGRDEDSESLEVLMRSKDLRPLDLDRTAAVYGTERRTPRPQTQSPLERAREVQDRVKSLTYPRTRKKSVSVSDAVSSKMVPHPPAVGGKDSGSMKPLAGKVVEHGKLHSSPTRPEERELLDSLEDFSSSSYASVPPSLLSRSASLKVVSNATENIPFNHAARTGGHKEAGEILGHGHTTVTTPVGPSVGQHGKATNVRPLPEASASTHAKQHGPQPTSQPCVPGEEKTGVNMDKHETAGAGEDGGKVIKSEQGKGSRSSPKLEQSLSSAIRNCEKMPSRPNPGDSKVRVKVQDDPGNEMRRVEDNGSRGRPKPEQSQPATVGSSDKTPLRSSLADPKVDSKVQDNPLHTRKTPASSAAPLTRQISIAVEESELQKFTAAPPKPARQLRARFSTSRSQSSFQSSETESVSRSPPLPLPPPEPRDREDGDSTDFDLESDLERLTAHGGGGELERGLVEAGRTGSRKVARKVKVKKGTRGKMSAHLAAAVDGFDGEDLFCHQN